MGDDSKFSPIIICGCKRSGTTALVRILNENGITISNEWALFAWSAWKHEYSLADWLHNKHVEVATNSWLQHWNHRIELSGGQAERGYPEALHSIYGNKPRWTWGDKWPDYVYHVKEIKEHFPNAKIIYIYRDGRDVVASMLRKGMADNLGHGFEQWVNAIEAWKSWEKDVEHLAIKQEDLLQYPAEVAAFVARYCGIRLESAKHARYVLLGSDEVSSDDYVSENRFAHTRSYGSLFSDDDVPPNARELLTSLGYH
ncbi:sulfotransferase [Phyllobacterium sp. 628]|uniref:sulfotransferase family protein n=1 Tax=Phyllobacterium sp. 628 TaxID=2718938 RepID=UPI0016624DB9|nr:sulfotransferase [Phyllobacterium sp. 628]QND51445.1 sulfotransferase [Phyllobacterium sp. 628]